MKSLRGERLSSEYQKAVYEIISTTLKNRTDKIKGLVSVTGADVSPDLKNAKIYVSILAKNDEEKKATFDELCAHAGFIRHELAHMMRSRTVPEIRFFWDGSFEYGEKIDRLIKQLEEKEDGKSTDGEGGK